MSALLPLEGIRVLDLTRLLPGGLTTLLLADLGADVIKIEAPDGGDYARDMPPLVDGMGALFRLLNRNKRSAILDLKNPRGQNAFKRLVERSDVVIESFRPGVLARLSIDVPALRAINPRLVVCSLSGWGQDGPYAHLPGHDLNYAALGGLVGSQIVPQPLGGQVADIGGAYAALGGILAALFRRERTGEGAVLDVSLFESALPFGSIAWTDALYGDPNGSLNGRYACYAVYETADQRHCALAALEPKFWANFCHAVARPDLIPYHMDTLRQTYLLQELRQLFAGDTLAAWTARLAKAECCFTAVTPPKSLADDAQIRTRSALGVDERGRAWLASPIRLQGARAPMTPPPYFGEHTSQVLREFGLDAAEIDALDS